MTCTDLQCINMVGAWIDNHITADVHLAEPTESNYVHLGDIAGTKLINSMQKAPSHGQYFNNQW